MKAEYSTNELAEILGVAAITIRRRAEAESWDEIKRPKRQGGHLYPYDSLPWSVQQIILARHLDLDPRYVGQPEMTLKTRLGAHQRLAAAPENIRAIALARFDTLELLNLFAADKGLGGKAARLEFTRLFLQREIPGGAYDMIRFLSRGTLELWQTKYSREGLPGLLPQWKKGGRKSRMTPALVALFTSELATLPHTRVCDLTRLMRARTPRETWVNRATVGRWLIRWKSRNQETHALMRNPSAWKNRYQPSQGSLSGVPYAGHTWEMDSTPADIMTLDEKPRRCSIIAAVDVYSRRAVVVVAASSKSDAVAACIRKGFMAWGVPQAIRKDNGADYSSVHIRGLLLALGVETPKLKPYTPEAKGHVERFFGTMTRELEERLPGYTGHSVADRAALREQQTWARRVMQAPTDQKAVGIPLKMRELQHLLDAWIADVYERRPHSGFDREPGRALKGLSPLEAFERSPKKPEIISDERALDVLLTPEGTKTVQKDGLHHYGARYVAPALCDYIRQKVTIRGNPEDAGSLYVFDNNRFICIARDEALTGLALEEYNEARNRHIKRKREEVRALKALGQAMHRPYTVELLSGRLAPQAPQLPGAASPPQLSGPNAEGDREPPLDPAYDPMVSALLPEPPPVIRLRKEFDNEAMQGVRAAVTASAIAAGEAIPETKVIAFTPPPPPVNPWEEPPKDIYDRNTAAIDLFKWHMDKQKAVGLTKEDTDKAIELWERYGEVRYVYQRPERVSDTEIKAEEVKL